MKYWFLILLLNILVTASGRGQQHIGLHQKELTDEQWRDDLRILYDSLQVNHLNLYHFNSKSAFDQKYHLIYNEIPQLTTEKIYLRFKQFVSLAGDGHTTLAEPPTYRKYPLDFFVFNNEVILVRSDHKYKTALGWSLVDINDHPISRIRDSLNTIVDHGESSLYVPNQQMVRLNIAEYLIAFGFVSVNDPAVFEFKKGKETLKIRVSTPEAGKYINWSWAYNPLPLFLKSGEGTKISINHFPLNSEIYYINFSAYPDWDEFNKITENIYDRMNQQKVVKKIIIDMRLNSGGNFDKGLKLMLPMFLNFNALHPNVKYYVIIGRQTFSAGMSNAVHFRDCLNAKLVGEATGAKPNGYQEIKWFTLPNSKWNASCSLLYYTFQKENSNGVQPDKKITPLFEEYKTGSDPVLSWIQRAK